jgi:hypothetical protein
MNTTTAPRFIGWFRAGKGRCWQAVVSGKSEQDTWDLLHDFRSGGRVCDKCVTAEGVDPNERRPR